MSLDAPLDVLIIGSGFAASTFAHFSRGLSLQVVDVSMGESGKPAVTVTPSKNSVFNQESFAATAGIGGGVRAWGGALTIPSQLNFFAKTDNEAWTQHYSEIRGIPGASLFPGIESRFSRRTARLNKKLRKFWIASGEEYFWEFHPYTSSVAKGVGPRKTSPIVPIPPAPLITGRVISIQRDSSNNWHTKVIVGTSEKIYISRQVVLASGAFLNACLLNLITGQSVFSIGNHCSAIAGRITFPKPRRLGELVQDYRPGSTVFATFALKSKNSVEDVGLGQSSLRLVWDDDSEPMQKIFHRFVPRVSSFLTRLARYFGWTRSALVRVMADQTAIQNNEFRIERFNNGAWDATLSLELHPTHFDEIDTLLGHFSAMTSLTDVSVFERFETSSKELLWADAAHYFGTTPVGRGNSFQVGSDLQLNATSGVYLLGLSTFANGSHAHPTLLAMLQAANLASRLSIQDQEEL